MHTNAWDGVYPSKAENVPTKEAMKNYNKSNIPYAKTLRKNMTPWERKLWYEFLRYFPVRFQRQKAIGNYIVDFYCAKAGIVVELDGGGHYNEQQIDADKTRTLELSKLNLRVIRICNSDIDKNFSGVCDYIESEVNRSLPPGFVLKDKTHLPRQREA